MSWPIGEPPLTAHPLGAIAGANKPNISVKPIKPAGQPPLAPLKPAYEWEKAKINPTAISAPKQIGLTFLAFQIGQRYKNSLTSSRLGDKRRHDGAPEGALIYPIKTKELQCGVYDASIKRWVTENEANCFKNRFGAWTGPWRTPNYANHRRS